MKKISINDNSAFQPSTIPNLQGGFEKWRKIEKNSNIRLTSRIKKGIAVDSLSGHYKIREGGELNHRKFLSGFN